MFGLDVFIPDTETHGFPIDATLGAGNGYTGAPSMPQMAHE